jgi:hypothetical protein
MPEQFDPMKHHQMPIESLDVKKIAARVREMTAYQRQTPAPPVNYYKHHQHDIEHNQAIVAEKADIISHCNRELRELKVKTTACENRIAKCLEMLDKNSTRPGALRAALADHRATLEKLEASVADWTERRDLAQRISDSSQKKLDALPWSDIQRDKAQFEEEERALESVR